MSIPDDPRIRDAENNGMTDTEWLARWEPIEAPGRHTRLYPAGFCHGYQYTGFCRMDKRPRADDGMYMEAADRVIRAIPVDGTVSDPEPAWMRSPQVRYWLQKEKPGLGERIRNWLRRPA